MANKDPKLTPQLTVMVKRKDRNITTKSIALTQAMVFPRKINDRFSMTSVFFVDKGGKVQSKDIKLNINLTYP